MCFFSCSCHALKEYPSWPLFDLTFWPPTGPIQRLDGTSSFFANFDWNVMVHWIIFIGENYYNLLSMHLDVQEDIATNILWLDELLCTADWREHIALVFHVTKMLFPQGKTPFHGTFNALPVQQAWILLYNDKDTSLLLGRIKKRFFAFQEPCS